MCVPRGMTMWRDSKKATLWEQKREASEKSNFAGTLILDFQDREVLGKKMSDVQATQWGILLGQL